MPAWSNRRSSPARPSFSPSARSCTHGQAAQLPPCNRLSHTPLTTSLAGGPAEPTCHPLRRPPSSAFRTKQSTGTEQRPPARIQGQSCIPTIPVCATNPACPEACHVHGPELASAPAPTSRPCPGSTRPRPDAPLHSRYLLQPPDDRHVHRPSHQAARMPVTPRRTLACRL